MSVEERHLEEKETVSFRLFAKIILSVILQRVVCILY